MTRHEKTCTADTKIRYKEAEYGSPDSIRQQLVDIGILDPEYEIEFISYDIETLCVEEEYDGIKFNVQKPISIGFFDGTRGDVFVGENIVERFIRKMKDIQVSILRSKHVNF